MLLGSLDRYEKALELSNEDFKQVIGVKKETFEVMVEILKLAYHYSAHSKSKVV